MLWLRLDFLGDFDGFKGANVLNYTFGYKAIPYSLSSVRIYRIDLNLLTLVGVILFIVDFAFDILTIYYLSTVDSPFVFEYILKVTNHPTLVIC